MMAVALGGSARAARPIPARVWDDLASDDPATRASAVAALEAAGPQAVAFLRARLEPVAADARRINALIEQLDSPQFVRRRQATEELEYLGKIAQPQIEKALAGKPPLEVRCRLEQLLKRLQPRALPRLNRERVEAMVRPAVPERPGRTTYAEMLRRHPGLVRNPDVKILLLMPGGEELTPRQLIRLAQLEQASGLREAAPEPAKGPRPRVAAPPVSPTWLRAGAAVRVLERVGNKEARDLLRRVAGGAADALPTVEARSALKRLEAKARP
jgi:hypothetical protein